MRYTLNVAALAAGLIAVGCHNQPSRDALTPVGGPDRGIFSDSVMHVARCEPTTPGEDWRTACTPRNQGVRFPPVPQQESPR